MSASPPVDPQTRQLLELVAKWQQTADALVKCGYPALWKCLHELDALVRSAAATLPRLADVEDAEAIARYYWPKDSMPSDEPEEWFVAAIRDAQDGARHRAAPLPREEPQPLMKAFTELLARIENGHKQSIGSIDNTRMVQFGIDEIARYRKVLQDVSAAAALREEPPDTLIASLRSERFLSPNNTKGLREEPAPPKAKDDE